jgi:hypothetical protein
MNHRAALVFLQSTKQIFKSSHSCSNNSSDCISSQGPFNLGTFTNAGQSLPLSQIETHSPIWSQTYREDYDLQLPSGQFKVLSSRLLTNPIASCLQLAVLKSRSIPASLSLLVKSSHCEYSCPCNYVLDPFHRIQDQRFLHSFP